VLVAPRRTLHLAPIGRASAGPIRRLSSLEHDVFDAELLAPVKHLVEVAARKLVDGLGGRKVGTGGRMPDIQDRSCPALCEG
jgi:hypothetical protein